MAESQMVSKFLIMNDKQLIFIVSQPRSGSTLLQAILSNNSDVATISEPWLLLPFLSYNRTDLIKARYSSELAKIGIEDFKSKINASKFNVDLLAFLQKQYSQIATNNEKYIIDKTPRYYEILDEIIEIFPKAKIIIIKRNPYAVLNSIINTWSPNNIDKLLSFKTDILNAPFIIHDFLNKHLNNENVKTISYEQITEEPYKYIKELYNWLGVKYSDNILTYSLNKKYIGLLGDPTGVHRNIKPISNKNTWNELLTKKKWRSFFYGYAKYLSNDFIKDYGYDIDITGRNSKTFDEFLLKASWKFNEFEIPLKKVIKSRIKKRLARLLRLKK